MIILGAFKILMDDEKIIHCIIYDDLMESDAESIIKRIEDLSQEIDKTCVQVNMGNVGESTSASRRIIFDAINSKSEFINRLAFFGVSARARVIANFIIKGSKLDDRVRYIEHEDEALKWLKE